MAPRLLMLLICCTCVRCKSHQPVPVIGEPHPALPAPLPEASEFVLTPYLKEILETIFFLVEIWHQREIQNGIDRVQVDLDVVDVKLNEILAARPLVGNPILTDLKPVRRPLAHRNHMVDDVGRIVKKLIKMFH